MVSNAALTMETCLVVLELNSKHHNDASLGILGLLGQVTQAHFLALFQRAYGFMEAASNCGSTQPHTLVFLSLPV